MKTGTSLVGQKFGNWTVVQLASTSGRQSIHTWLCRCACGKRAKIPTFQLTSGRSSCCRSCGHEKRVNNLLGQTFGSWTVIRRAKQINRKRGAYWFCRCSCGATRSLTAGTLRHGKRSKCRKCFRPGKYIAADGYVMLWNPKHVNVRKSGYVLEHVAIMSNRLRRPLLKEETVHHKNGIRHDNRLCNLELWTCRHPGGQRTKDIVQFCRQQLMLYAPALLRNQNE